MAYLTVDLPKTHHAAGLIPEHEPEGLTLVMEQPPWTAEVDRLTLEPDAAVVLEKSDAAAH